MFSGFMLQKFIAKKFFCFFTTCVAVTALATDTSRQTSLHADMPEHLLINLGSGVNMDFVLIHPGSFVMGSTKSPLKDQKPPHQVTITQPFYLGRFEVTQEQWQVVMSNTPSVHKGPLFPDSAKCPVENVSWKYCQVFLTQLKNRISGWEFRLPTEAEWEYACRAGTTNEFSFAEGTNQLGEFAWHSGNSKAQTHPVGLKLPNAWGLHDMHGNVWEWCSDIYGPYSEGDVSDPKGPSAGPTRVLRGGAYNSIVEHLTSAYRHDLEDNETFRYYGLRCVATPKTNP
jgi:formylglycine-generating enzyme required for sulfatase activity